ncbi:MAG: PEP-CTERM sorting domain-containing protein [Chthoniobacterales bacterium]
MAKIILSCFAILVISITSLQAIVITGFGSTGESGASAFTVDTNNTNFNTSGQTAFTLPATGTDSNVLIGTFTPINITGNSTIQLTLAVSGTNPNSAFTVRLYSSDFSFRTYSGFLSSFGSSQTTVVLTPGSGTITGNTVVAFGFFGGGSGNSLNLTFDTITAVPEPSSYVLMIIGAMVLSRIAFKRRTQAEI